MNTKNNLIIDWVIKKVQLEYANDICLLVVYGSYINNTEDNLSDLDFYFIPNTDRAYKLKRTFIVEGIGYDLFPMNWERVEGLANFNESLTSLLRNAQVVYFSSDEHIKRFERLKGILNQNLSDPVFMHHKAIAKNTQAIHSKSMLDLHDDLCNCRLFSGDILTQLADTGAYENLTYFQNGLKNLLADLKQMKKLPTDFVKGFEAVIKANSILQIRETCDNLLVSCKTFLNSDTVTSAYLPQTDKFIQKAKDINYHQLAELYSEIISTFNEVYKYCENNDHILAFISAVSLQHTLNQDTQGFRFDILSDYDAEDLNLLSKSLKSTEMELAKLIEKEVKIIRYTSADEFLKENSKRD